MSSVEPRKVASIYSTVALLESLPGSTAGRYAVPLDSPNLYRWAPLDASTVDHVTVLGSSGGTPGAWLLVRANDRGADLADESATITVAGGAFRVLPAATLSGAQTLTIGVDGAMVGDSIEVLCLDDTQDFLVANGGPATGTLADFTTVRGYLRAWFDGTDWIPRASGQLL